MSTRTIGVDLGVTSASDIAVAEGMTVTSTRKVASNPAALTAAFAKLGENGPVNVVVEATAMAWFVATVAVMRSGIDATLFRISGTKAAALRKFYRQHTKTDRIDARVLARMPLVDDGLHEFRLPAPGELALKRRHLESQAGRRVSEGGRTGSVPPCTGLRGCARVGRP